jgi:DNA-binding MarR family transcriptional regulator
VISRSVPPGPSVLLALQRATHLTMHMLAARVADLDLTPSEINALANLADGHGRSASELAAAVGTRPTTLTGVLDRLERRGYIARRAHATDRRAVLIELTEGGRAVADTVRRAFADLEEQALADLGSAAVAGFRDVLRALTGAAS